MTTKPVKFEAAMQSLETLVTQLERGDLPLEDALQAFEHGMQLVQQCQQRLNDAELRIEKILTTATGPTVEKLNLSTPSAGEAS